MPSMKFDIEQVTQEQLDAMGVTKEFLYERNREKEKLTETAPEVGSLAPDFDAEELSPAGKRTGQYTMLSTLRGSPVGLLFGSYTCPIFRAQIDRCQEIYRELGNDVEFLCVYILEAHPENGWRVPHNFNNDIFIQNPTSLNERAEVAKTCIKSKDMTIPMVLDTMSNEIMKLYAGTPERLYAIDPSGIITFCSAIGPFDDDEVEAWYGALKALAES